MSTEPTEQHETDLRSHTMLFAKRLAKGLPSCGVSLQQPPAFLFLRARYLGEMGEFHNYNTVLCCVLPLGEANEAQEGKCRVSGGRQ